MSGARTNLVRTALAETIGTAILVFVGPGAVMVSVSTNAFGQTGIAIAFALVIMVLVASLGAVSGAHLNPAVTLMFWSRREIPGRRAILYIIGQCAGAVVAAFVLRWLLGPVADVGATLPSVGAGRAFGIEAVYSAILALVILATATNARVQRAAVPIAIGATVGLGALVTGPLTGGSFNPARSLGPALASGRWDAHWIYWVAPIGGMLIASRLWKLVRGATTASAE